MRTFRESSFSIVAIALMLVLGLFCSASGAVTVSSVTLDGMMGLAGEPVRNTLASNATLTANVTWETVGARNVLMVHFNPSAGGGGNLFNVFASPRNLRQTKSLLLLSKGDGSSNTYKIIIKENGGESWISPAVSLSRTFLSYDTFNISSFTYYAGTGGNRILDLDQISQYLIHFEGSQSVLDTQNIVFQQLVQVFEQPSLVFSTSEASFNGFVGDAFSAKTIKLTNNSLATFGLEYVADSTIAPILANQLATVESLIPTQSTEAVINIDYSKLGSNAVNLTGYVKVYLKDRVNDSTALFGTIKVTVKTIKRPSLTMTLANTSPSVDNGSTMEAQMLMLKNVGGYPTNWQLSDNLSWVTFGPSSGTLLSGESVTIKATFDATSVNINQYLLRMTVVGTDVLAPVTQEVNVQVLKAPLTPKVTNIFPKSKITIGEFVPLMIQLYPQMTQAQIDALWAQIGPDTSREAGSYGILVSEGLVDSTVSIEGTDLIDGTGGAGKLLVGGLSVYFARTQNQLSFKIPKTLPAGMVDIRYEVLDYGRDKLSDPVFFIVRNPVAPVPTIESLSPSSGEAGSTISITGSGFGASKEAVQVLFAGSTGATISSISNTSIVVKVPDFLTAGTYPVTVKLAYAVNGQVNYATSNAVNYLVKAPVIVVPQPAITNLTPASGEAGSTISITGSGFGTSKEAVQVLFAGNTGSTVLSVTNTSIVLKVPDFLTAGTYPVTVKLAYAANGQVNYATSNAVNYLVKAPVIVVPQPAITSLTPASGEAGSTISITGSGFGASKEVVQVLFADSTGATVLSVANTSILVRVPDFLTPGTYPVSVKMAYAASGQINYVTSNAMNYKVVLAPVTPEVFVTPVISSLSVPSGEAGTVLIIYGNDFGSSQGLSELLFGQQAANVIAWEKGQIVVIVPALTKGAYPVMVKRKNSQGEVLISNAVNYSINSGSEIIVEEITDPILDLITPSRVLPGTIVRLAGENFGSEQGLSYVTIAGVPVETRMWSDTIIFVQVPSYLTRGTYTIKVEKKKATTSQLLAKSSNGADLVITAASTQLVPYPNPFSPALGNSINIEVTSAGVAQAELAIYDLSGRKIWGKFWSLVAGVNTTAWNGRDYASQLVGDGIYLVRVSSGSQTIAKGKILVVK